MNGLGGNGKKGGVDFIAVHIVTIKAFPFLCLAATFTVHVKGLRQVALQNVKNPELWLQVKDDELSGNVRETLSYSLVIQVHCINLYTSSYNKS